MKYNNQKKTAILIGTGPSLREIDIKLLKDWDTMTFNRAYIAFEDWGFDPTYYVSIDSNDLRAMYKDINGIITNSKIKYFFLADCQDNVFHSEIHFQNRKKVSAEDMFISQPNVLSIRKSSHRFGNISFEPHTGGIDMHHYPNVGLVGLCILRAMGYEEVALIGCDARYRDDTESNKYIEVDGNEYHSTKDFDLNHFRNDYFGKGMRFGRPNEKQIIAMWNSIRPAIDALDNFEVYSCTPGSNLNESYTYIDFNKFLKGERN